MALLFFMLVVAGAGLWLFAYGPEKPDPVARGKPIDAHPAGSGRRTPQPSYAANGADGEALNHDTFATHGCAVEAALVAQLLDGVLRPSDYHRAMEAIAATDAVREPLDVPPDRLR